MGLRTRGRTLEWLALLPPLFVAALVWLLGSDVPYWDDWDLVPILARAKAGAAGLDDYFAMYGVHRFVFPKAILTAVALVTGWNVRVQLMINVAVACATFAGIALIAGRDRGSASGLGSAVALGSSLAIFSFAQYDNWLWSGQIGYFLSIALIVWAIVALARARWPSPARIGLAALLCAAATFSIGFGVVAWVALAPLVWAGAERRKTAMVIWVAVAVACVFVYMGGAELPPAAATATEATPGAIALFFIAVAGTPWTSLAAPALLLGASSLALFAVLAFRAVRSDPGAAMPWISLGLVAVGFAGLTALIRSRLGWSIADSPRYATPMLLMTVATLHLAARLDIERYRARLIAILVGILLFANVSFLPVFWTTAASRHVNRVCTDLAFVLGEARADCIPSAGPQADLPEKMETARARGLRPFADRTWFSAVELPARDVRMTATSIEGKSAPSLLPAPLLVTRGPARESIALGWGEASGSWVVRIDPRLHRPSDVLEVWTIPLHEKRLVRVALRSAGNS